MKHKYAKKILNNFDSFVEKTIFKLKDKTNNFFKYKSKVSNLNKSIIVFISLLFLYLFYLSIPTLYDKTWVQNTIEKKLLEDFGINFSTSSEISYLILPSPHFLIENSKIFKNTLEKPVALSEIKKLKVFISQKNFFKKEKIDIIEVIIDDANFSLKDNDFKFLFDSSSNKFSDKKIFIKKSNIFFKDEEDATISIIKVPEGYLFYDNKKLLNSFNLKGEVFKIPFTFDLISNLDLMSKEVEIDAKKLKLNIFNEFTKDPNGLTNGINIVTALNLKIQTKYNVKKNITTFESEESKIKNSQIDYKGKLSLNPFDFRIDANIDKYELSKLLSTESILIELIKTKLLFNENISAKISIVIRSHKNEEIFKSSKINLNIINGRINFDKTKLFNEKIGSLEINNSNLFSQDGKFILNTGIFIDIQNSNNLFSFFQTPKKLRKPIKSIFINLDYDLLTNQININNLKFDGIESNEEMLGVIRELIDGSDYNLNKSRRIFNKLLLAYSG